MAYNIAANQDSPAQAAETAQRGYVLGQQAREVRLEQGYRLDAFKKQQKVDKARETLYTAQPGSEEHKGAYGTLMALDRDGLMKDQEFAMGEANLEIKQAEAKNIDTTIKNRNRSEDAAATQEQQAAYTAFAPVATAEIKRLQEIPEGERAGVLQSRMGGILEQAPEGIRADLQQGLEEALKDGKLTDDELADLSSTWNTQLPEEKGKGQLITDKDGFATWVFENGESINSGVKVREPKGQTINIGEKDKLSEWQKTLQDKTATIGADVVEAYEASIQSDNDLDIMEAFLDQGVDTGMIESFLLGPKSILADLGFNVGEGVALQEAFGAVSTNLALSMTDKTKGAISDKEMALFLKAVPALALSEEGNRIIIEVMRYRNTQTKAWADRVFANENPTLQQMIQYKAAANIPLPPALLNRIKEATPQKSMRDYTEEQFMQLPTAQQEALIREGEAAGG